MVIGLEGILVGFNCGGEYGWLEDVYEGRDL